MIPSPQEDLVLRFRTSAAEDVERERMEAELLQLSDEELEEACAEQGTGRSYCARYHLSWRLALSGDAAGSTDILRDLRGITLPDDYDIIDVTQKYWTAIANRKPLQAWSYQREQKILDDDDSSSHLVRVFLYITAERWPLVKYIPWALGVALVIAAIFVLVLIGGLLFTAVLVALLVALIVILTMGFFSDSGDTSFPRA